MSDDGYELSYGLPRTTGGVTKLRALVVEDDPDLNRQLRQALSDAGFAVDCARDGEEGFFLGENGALRHRHPGSWPAEDGWYQYSGAVAPDRAEYARYHPDGARPMER